MYQNQNQNQNQTPDQTPKKKGGCLKVLLISGISMLVLGSCVSAMGSTDTSSEPAPSATTSAPTTTSQAPTPATLEDKLKALGDYSFEVHNADDPETTLFVTFEVPDNLTAKLRTGRAQTLTVDILKVVRDSAEGQNRAVTLTGTFPLVDQYGNTEQGDVLRLTYSAETMSKLNFDGYTLNRTIWNVADSKYIHRELAEHA